MKFERFFEGSGLCPLKYFTLLGKFCDLWEGGAVNGDVGNGLRWRAAAVLTQ